MTLIQHELKNAYIGEYIPLKSYEEIISIFTQTASISNVTAELNKYPQDYYNKFVNENHIYTSSGKYYLSDNGTGVHYFIYGGERVIFYNGSVWNSERA